MASYDVIIDSDLEFDKNSQSANALSDLVIQLNGETLNNSSDYTEGDDDAFAEGLFSLDEDMEPEKEMGEISKWCTSFEPLCDDEEESNDSGNFDLSRTQSLARRVTIGERSSGASAEIVEQSDEGQVSALNDSVAFGTSLPITIPAGRFWPPRDAFDSVNNSIFLNSDEEDMETRAKTVLPQRPPKDLYSEMRAQARSIQAVDDPERLFGERPQRRRYRTGQNDDRTIQVALPQHEDAVIVVAANTAEQN